MVKALGWCSNTGSGPPCFSEGTTKKQAVQLAHYPCFLSMLGVVNEIPEERQAAALKAVADAGKLRADALAEAERILTQQVRPRAIAAARLGVNRTRIRELAGVGPSTLYAWLEEAGLEVRPKRSAKKQDAE